MQAASALTICKGYACREYALLCLVLQIRSFSQGQLYLMEGLQLLVEGRSPVAIPAIWVRMSEHHHPPIHPIEQRHSTC